MSIFNEEQFRQAIENFQKTHPVAFAYDISHFDGDESLDIIRREIDRLSEKAEKDSEMHIIFEMAKQYMNGARPTYNRSKGEWIKVNPEKRGYAEIYRCSNCLTNVQLSYWDKECEYNYCPNCGAEMREADNDKN